MRQYHVMVPGDDRQLVVDGLREAVGTIKQFHDVTFDPASPGEYLVEFSRFYPNLDARVKAAIKDFLLRSTVTWEPPYPSLPKPGVLIPA